jgi:hypothetical protein
MKSLGSRFLAAAILATLAWITLSAASGRSGSDLQPNKLIILSTSDVRGKTSPCG